MFIIYKISNQIKKSKENNIDAHCKAFDSKRMEKLYHKNCCTQQFHVDPLFRCICNDDFEYSNVRVFIK
jgi:hypothetical protein